MNNDIDDSETILLIDDEEINRFLGKDMLESLGYKAITAETGKEALEIYKRRRENIDLVITDIMMPGMNGEDVIVELRKINPTCKIVVSSGYFKEDRLLEQKFVSYLQKPYTIDELSKIVNDSLQIG